MTPEIMRAIMGGCALKAWSAHGLEHWGRVLANGTRLAESVDVDLEVVELFAVFHDCRRVNEHRDPDHGRRGADFAATLRDNLLKLEPARFELLHYACTHHTDGLTEGDPTVEVCWDADRLDLSRVGITPYPQFLCTEAAKQNEILDWANERASRNLVTPVAKQWFEWTGQGDS